MTEFGAIFEDPISVLVFSTVTIGFKQVRGRPAWRPLSRAGRVANSRFGLI